MVKTQSLITEESCNPLETFNCAHEDKHISILSCFKVFSETSIGGNAYLRNMVHLPFFLQNSGFRFETCLFFFLLLKGRRFKVPYTKHRGMLESQRYPFKPNNNEEDVDISIVFEAELRKSLHKRTIM